MCKFKTYAFGLQTFIVIACFVYTAISISCAPTAAIGRPVETAKLVDGTYKGGYRGGPNKAIVEVTIKDNSIVNINIIQHQAWRGKMAEETVVERIIAHQSTRVDAVSGATNSSYVIMNAVQLAIEKAEPGFKMDQ